jgi:hypothetical protein
MVISENDVVRRTIANSGGCDVATVHHTAPAYFISNRFCPALNGLDLVRQRANARQAHCELPIVSVRQANSRRFNQELHVGRVNQTGRFLPSDVLTQALGFVPREDDFLKASVRQTHATLATLSQGANGLQDNGFREVPRQRDALTRGKLRRHLLPELRLVGRATDKLGGAVSSVSRFPTSLRASPFSMNLPPQVARRNQLVGTQTEQVGLV